MRIAIDGMGGDNAPFEIVRGCIEASKQINHEITIVGSEEQIKACLKKLKYSGNRITITPASEVIENTDSPVKSVRTKTDSSMVVGVNLLKEKKADLLISAGNTGALMTASLFNLGRIQGIDRPVIATTYPILGKGFSLLADSGANAECKPNNLLEFGLMGSIYMEKVMGIANPTVGLINIGAEETKGTTVIKAAFELLKKSNLNFVGNVEARDIPDGGADVLVCDGFIGNVILKLTEGVAIKLFKRVKGKFTENLVSRMSALLLVGKLKDLREELDYSEYGGAPILGVKGAVIKIHGSSNAKAVRNAIIKAIPFAQKGVIQMIQDEVLALEELEE